MNAVPARIEARRAEAAENFRAVGVPHRRIEEWKYSDLRSVADWNAVEQAGALRWSMDRNSDAVEMFDLASRDGAPGWVTRNLGVLSRGNAMDAASLAFAQSGFALRVPSGQSGEVHVNFSGAGQARILIVLEENAELSLVETAEAFSGFQNIGVEVLLAPHARLTHARRTARGNDAVRVAELSLGVAQGAVYRGHFADFGAKLSRTELYVSLDGEGAEAHLSGVGVLGGETHADVTTHIVHAVGNTRSTQLFKNVAGGNSRAVYQGKVTVREGANGSDSRQTAKALLLGMRAEADLKPELEIFADDVKCAHGAAVGDLDAESLFYLRSRGVPEAEARDLLIRAFLDDAVMEIGNDDVRAGVWHAVEAALSGALEGAP